MANNDPNTEPENSTLDDEWLGQQVNRDADKVDEALAETNGDEQAAIDKLEGA